MVLLFSFLLSSLCVFSPLARRHTHTQPRGRGYFNPAPFFHIFFFYFISFGWRSFSKLSKMIIYKVEEKPVARFEHISEISHITQLSLEIFLTSPRPFSIVFLSCSPSILADSSLTAVKKLSFVFSTPLEFSISALCPSTAELT